MPAAGALAFVPKPRPPMPTHSNVPSFGQDYSKSGRFPKKVPQQVGVWIWTYRKIPKQESRYWLESKGASYNGGFLENNMNLLKEEQ